MEGEDKITIITTENDEPKKQEQNENADMEGIPTWAKELKAAMSELSESMKDRKPEAPKPEQPSKSSTIPQPPPAPKKEPEAQPVKKESLLGKAVKFLF